MHFMQTASPTHTHTPVWLGVPGASPRAVVLPLLGVWKTALLRRERGGGVLVPVRQSGWFSVDVVSLT